MSPAEDSAWKDLLDKCFEDFLAFFFPEIHGDIDWPSGYEFLDKELEPILRHAEMGRQLVDKLVKLRLLDGHETWLLIHIEVQGKPERDFARRMYVYNYRIDHRYDREVISLAVLTDFSDKFRPRRYEHRRWGFDLSMAFPVVKIMDYEPRRAELEASLNPFAAVVLVHLDGRMARTVRERYDVKFQLARRMYGQGFRKKDIIVLLRFLDWLIRLPLELEEDLSRKVKRELEGKVTMPYVTSWERIAKEKGRKEGIQKGRQEGKQEGRQEGLQEGLQEAIRLSLESRFGKRSLPLLPRVKEITDIGRLRTIVAAIPHMKSLRDLDAFLAG